MNQQGKYVVCESTDYGCKVYNVVNTETGNRINYYPDYESAKEFAERQNRMGMNKIKNRRLALRAYKIRVKQYPYNKPLIDRKNLAFLRKENDGNRCDCFGHWRNYWNTRPF